MKFTKEEYIDTYRMAYYGRKHEEFHLEYAMAGRSLGGLHLASGEEAVYCGVYSEVGPDDWYLPHHRARPVCGLRYGTRAFECEVQAKIDGGQQGVGGGAHYFSVEKKIGPRIALLGQTQTVGAGIAQYYKQTGHPGCVVIGMGDGDINLGAVSETLNIVAAWKLPVAFYVQNNGLAISTPVEYSTGTETLSERAAGFGIPSATYDGHDLYLVKEVMRESIARARKGEPNLCEFRTTRWEGHFVGDPVNYRDPAVVEEAKKHRDPVANARKFLLENDIATEEELTALEQAQEKLLREDFEASFESPRFTREQLREYVQKITLA